MSRLRTGTVIFNFNLRFLLNINFNLSKFLGDSEHWRNDSRILAILSE